jgi:hypothetical protein
LWTLSSGASCADEEMGEKPNSRKNEGDANAPSWVGPIARRQGVGFHIAEHNPELTRLNALTALTGRFSRFGAAAADPHLLCHDEARRLAARLQRCENLHPCRHWMRAAIASHQTERR